MLFDVDVLPIRLLIMVVVPAVLVLLIPKKSVLVVGAELSVRIDPMVLFSTSTVPVLDI